MTLTKETIQFMGGPLEIEVSNNWKVFKGWANAELIADGLDYHTAINMVEYLNAGCGDWTAYRCTSR